MEAGTVGWMIPADSFANGGINSAGQKSKLHLKAMNAERQSEVDDLRTPDVNAKELNRRVPRKVSNATNCIGGVDKTRLILGRMQAEKKLT
jgi:hypothetical protein